MQPDQEPAVRVAGGLGHHVELVVLVAAVGLRLAQVVRQAGGPQDRAGDTEGGAADQVEVADALGARLPDPAVHQQVGRVLEVGTEQLDALADLVDRTRGQVLRDAARADVRVVHPQPGDQLEQVEHGLALAEAEDHRGQRAELHATGRQRDQVGGHPVELHHQHPDDAGPLRDLVGDAEQLLDREAVRRLVEQRGEVVHPGHERDGLGPVAVLEVLLDAGVEVPDADAGLGDGLAVQLEDQPEHAVGRRVLRAHVHHDALGVLVGDALDHGVPVLTGDGEDGALGGLPAARRGCVVGRARRGGALVRHVLGRAHQVYDLRWSGGGISAPLYSTGMPPSG